LIECISAVLYRSEKRIVKEISAMLVGADLAELLSRAQRACEETARLVDDRRFILTWCRMHRQFATRSSLVLDGED
jgi:hypothetical protein